VERRHARRGAHIARLCPMGMISVPSKSGRSHCPDERTELADTGIRAHAARCSGPPARIETGQQGRRSGPARWQDVAMSTVELLGACTRVRVAAEDHMDGRDRAGLGWAEESVTDAAVHQGLPELRVVQFNRHQESRVGADYLWWWLDRDSDECFGMLVQAKRLHRVGGRWTVDIGHRNGKQLADLLRSADRFQVPAIYSVYTGGPVFRRDLPCFHGKEPDCLGCRRMAISLSSAYQLCASSESPVDVAGLVLNYSTPLEDLVDPACSPGPIWDVNLTELGPGELRDFLLRAQCGPKEVARRMFKVIADDRRSSFSAALAEPTTVAGAPIFPTVPKDTGHYPGSYFDHFLRGLRWSLPEYVRDLRQGRAVSAEISDQVDGVVLVTM
jgi:hypothetical protein